MRSEPAGPSVWQAIICDPTLPFDRSTLWQVVRDQRRWSRRWLYPWLRLVSRGLVAIIRLVKLLLPVRLAAHSTMDRLCIWFLRRFVAADAVALLLRHFVVETNLLNFVVANAGHPGLSSVGLRPTTLAELGNHAVIQHDINVYDVLIGLGVAGGVSGSVPRPLPADLDLSMLDVPALDPEPHRRRLLTLDIQTALCLMNIPFALCLTTAEYERAVHSMRLDDSLLAVLAQLTGDPTFWRWCGKDPVVRVDPGVDVPAAVYRHAVVCEYAHERLRELSATHEDRRADRDRAGSR